MSLTASGNKIYVGWDNDIGILENLGGDNWSILVKLDSPISSEAAEAKPSINADETELVFLRTVRDSIREDWKEIGLVSTRLPNGSWSVPKPLGSKLEAPHYEEFIQSEDGQMIFNSTSGGPTNHNWYSRKTDSGFSEVTELSLSTVRLTWAAGNFSTALANVYTFNSIRIATVKFDHTILKAQPTKEQSISRAETPITMETTTVKPTGSYHGLIIGVSNYQDSHLNLEFPVQDARKLQRILIDRYGFDDEHLMLLENPTRQQILAAFFSLRSQITSDDNLLVFFAGHGFWDAAGEQGYWWPANASQAEPSNWLSNSDLREQIRGIKSAHTLVISDACFSGGIFRSRGANEIKTAPLSIQQLYKSKSRRAITSGNLSSVPDRSVFLKYLIERLESNNEAFLPAQTLFGSFRLAVMNNSLQNPQEGVILDSGDEGGDFIFIKH